MAKDIHYLRSPVDKVQMYKSMLNYIFKSFLNECQNFPGNKIPGQKISRQNIAGWKILGPENSGNTKFSWNSRKKIRENSRIFFFRGQKIPGFLAPLNSRIENSVTEFPRTFFAIYGFLGAKQRQNLPFLGLAQESRNGATFLSA